MIDNPERVTYFAATDSRGKRVPFGIKQRDRDRHMYVIGKTGMGKSTLLENMAIQDLRNGEGLVFIDPHGGTVDKLLEYIPEDRINDVVYFAPFDMENPIAFNVMEDVGYDKRHLVVSGLMATFKKIWEDAWSARMEYILTNTLLALLEYPDATLLGVNRMYTDKAYRTKVVDNVKDPVVKDFWVKEFANYGDRYTQEATPAIQNKIGQFTGNPLIRNIIGQPKSSFDIRTMMDQRKILIINLSKGLVGETNMRLLGSMLTTRIFLGAMSRAELSADQITKLPHFYFYVDEFQNFANETFAEILSESRKYRLNLTIAHQYVEQMEEEVRDAVFGNVGTTVVFRVGPFDAETLETLFMPTFTKEDIVALGPRQIYLSLMIDGVGSPPFSAVTIPPIEPPPITYKQQVIEASRRQFSTPRAGIEAAVVKELMDSAESEAPQDARMRKVQYKKTPGGRAPRTVNEVLAEQGSEIPSAPTVRVAPPRPSIEASMPRPVPPTPNLSQRSSDLPVRATQAGARPFARGSASSERRSLPAADAVPMAPKSKSADDLKSILRTMTTKTGEEKGRAQSAKQDSLKSALADVLKKNGDIVAPPAVAAPVAQPQPAVPKPISQPAPMSQSPSLKASADQGNQQPKPFEIPEEQLRAILRGE